MMKFQKYKLCMFLLILFFGKLSYSLLTYKSSKFDPDTAKVVVVIHGCMQSAQIMYDHSGWNEKADVSNLVILYPQVQRGSNIYDCWNWFLPYNQSPYMGQLNSIQKGVIGAIETLKIKSPKVFTMGISSGATTALGLLACYPDFFSGGAAISGAAYGSAYSFLNVNTVLSKGPQKSFYVAPCSLSEFKGKLLIAHGIEDGVVNILHSDKTINSFLSKASFTEETKEKIENNLFFLERVYFVNDEIQAIYLKIEDMGHTWPGYQGDEGVNYFLKKGPDVTQKAWEMFELH